MEFYLIIGAIGFLFGGWVGFFGAIVGVWALLIVASLFFGIAELVQIARNPSPLIAKTDDDYP